MKSLISLSLFALAALTAVAAGGALVTSNATHAESSQQAFSAESEAAMQKMMLSMHVAPSGDIDRDFATMMIPHHQGAIDMAVAELRYGRNEQLRRLAQEIIVEQQQEIDAMRLAIGLPAASGAAAPTQGDICTTVDNAHSNQSTSLATSHNHVHKSKQ